MKGNDTGEMVVETTDIEKFQDRNVATQPDIQPTNILELAIKQNMTPEQIEKFWEIQQKIDADIAKKSYVKAMSEFKKNPPEITKDQNVTYGEGKNKVSYNHASLANVAHKIGKALAEQDLSVSWSTKQGEGGLITVRCTITHSLGHSESTELAASPDQTGSKNNTQAIGSTMSYLERYTILALTGLATHEMDNDGRGLPSECITEDQALEIEGMIKDLKEKEKPWLDWIGSETVRDIPAKKYRQMVTALKARAK